MTIAIINARLAGEVGADSWILIEGQKIKEIGRGAYPEAAKVIDARGALVMPGAIDCHVHFREPGMTRKADIASESRAAAAGGVTSYLEMPNTAPPTTTLEAWRQKCDIAAADSLVNYAFFLGATNDNIDTLKHADYSRIPGIKVFMGSSTGNMLVDNDSTLRRIFAETTAIVAAHCEDTGIINENIAEWRREHGDGQPPMEMHSRFRSAEACIASSSKAAELAREYGHRLHLCHITTAAELNLISGGATAERLITGEVSPHHLMWCDTDYAARGSRIKMNPAVKTAADRDALRRAVADGPIDIVATDHAPHLPADKQGSPLTAASGAPLVQFALPWMLDNFDETVVERVMCKNPALVYGIDRRGAISSGNYADIVIVDETEPWTVTDADVVSKCGWTPLDGTVLRHRVRLTMVNGSVVFDSGSFAAPASALPLHFVTHNS